MEIGNKWDTSEDKPTTVVMFCKTSFITICLETSLTMILILADDKTKI